MGIYHDRQIYNNPTGKDIFGVINEIRTANANIINYAVAIARPFIKYDIDQSDFIEDLDHVSAIMYANDHKIPIDDIPARDKRSAEMKKEIDEEVTRLTYGQLITIAESAPILAIDDQLFKRAYNVMRLREDEDDNIRYLEYFDKLSKIWAEDEEDRDLAASALHSISSYYLVTNPAIAQKLDQIWEELIPIILSTTDRQEIHDATTQAFRQILTEDNVEDAIAQIKDYVDFAIANTTDDDLNNNPLYTAIDILIKYGDARKPETIVGRHAVDNISSAQSDHFQTIIPKSDTFSMMTSKAGRMQGMIANNGRNGINIDVGAGAIVEAHISTPEGDPLLISEEMIQMQNVIGNLMQRMGRPICLTSAQLYREYISDSNYNSTVSDQNIAFVDRIMTAITSTQSKLDFTEQIKKQTNLKHQSDYDYTQEKHERKGALVLGEYRNDIKGADGKYCKGWAIYEYPMYYRYSHVIGQIGIYPKALMLSAHETIPTAKKGITKRVYASTDRATVERHLLTRISDIQREGKKAADEDRKKKKPIRKTYSDTITMTKMMITMYGAEKAAPEDKPDVLCYGDEEFNVKRMFKIRQIIQDTLTNWQNMEESSVSKWEAVKGAKNKLIGFKITVKTNL